MYARWWIATVEELAARAEKELATEEFHPHEREAFRRFIDAIHSFAAQLYGVAVDDQRRRIREAEHKPNP